MKNNLKHLVCGFSALYLAGILVFASSSGTETVQAASIFHTTDGTVHFLTLPDNTDAIFLECNGKFVMVDSGENSDYPNGSDSRYPLRAGVTTTKGMNLRSFPIYYYELKNVDIKATQDLSAYFIYSSLLQNVGKKSFQKK